MFQTILLIILTCGSMQAASAAIFINEFLADPANGLAGDANNDGTRSSSDDEFIELLNWDPDPMNLTGWSLSDASAVRHIFLTGTIMNPYQYLVVFGGGTPHLTDAAVTASTGGLNLNNTGDTITLRNDQNQVIDQVIYGSDANKDQSLVRAHELPTDPYILHTTISQYGGKAFSPGYGLRPPPEETVIPEIPTIITAILGFAGIWLRRRG